MVASDNEIIMQCLKGDVDAFELLISKYKRLIYSTAYRMMGNNEEAEDISQEVFIRIYNSLHRYNPEYKFTTWIMKITSNLCLDYLRKRKGEAIPLDDGIIIKDDKDTPEEEYLRKENSKVVQQAINRIPDKYREYLILYHYRNLSYQEIMDIKEEPLTLVKNRLYRARQMLKEQLSDLVKGG